MRISVLAYGSRGDVQPYLALSLALARAGHHVHLAAPAMFSEMVQQYTQDQTSSQGDAITFFPLTGDPTRLMGSASSPSPLTKMLPSSLRMALTVVRFVLPLAARLIEEIREATSNADLIIHTLLTSVIGHQIARQKEIRDICALVFPVFTPTQSFPNPLFSPWPAWMRLLGKQAAGFGPYYNFLTHREFNRVFWHGNRIAIQRLLRRGICIPPLESWPFATTCEVLPQAEAAHSAPVLYGISRHALPINAEAPLRERMTGYWFLDAAPTWRPPTALERFIESGPPPLFIGFGSVISSNAKQLTKLIVEALRQSGQRAVLLKGWSSLDSTALPDFIFPVDPIPYDWLFPRVVAAIHHGGMGTAAAAMRAGIPQLVIPFAFDQYFWGRQVQILGVGPQSITHDKLTIQRLATAIDTLTCDASMHAAAKNLGEAIRAENGLQNAVRLIEAEAGSGPDE